MSLALGPLTTVALIFGGCCSNVFALEAIIKTQPSSGLLITFCQWLCTTSAAYATQFAPGSPYTVRPPKVPVRRWAVVALMHCSISLLNNWAFAFSISVPVHIVLRSFGSVSTMLMGIIRGKRYSFLQMLSVAILTVGVLVSAWADSESKGKKLSLESNASESEFTTGLMLLLMAQLLSAYMGAYVEDTYTMYKGTHWTENLFYAHFLSLPLFLPLSETLRQQYRRLAATPPLSFDHKKWQVSMLMPSGLVEAPLVAMESLPQGIFFLSLTVLTQLVCISGVNLLSSKSSAVTVTVVLNIRKLVSFIISTAFFGHQLSAKMVLGSALVFGSGALYGWETSWRLPQKRKRLAATNGSAKPRSREGANGHVKKQA
ncbi:hypothetical protein BAUCODRAFT_76247 [Baudoinia panamericana UAMH 10762]|uniref:Sugar phosphate transporter domain-containing protein n=1 Tax=Baudoinia panamericana (strain UAMH 10762) TaxID=717646 RepID=M2N3A8_BAUPA|nr:uncharacterized protein BAUCODRAFT_76247 [Baudoinia panamericana UAMH 10762]EMC93195.1 hypothetical protein BAUCODRAFT_76247 [Baudoinia panamericana UAMH 10762]